MATFDFITDDDFRTSLESDYRELNAALEAKCWKAVHILAGSIIEAVLVYYLTEVDYQQQTGKDPLKMILAEAIAACKSQGVLTQTAEDLSNVVREYRNLIHPGKLIRERQVIDEDRANVARSLVEIIVKEITKKRMATYGYTAEQIVARLESDPSRIALLEHLLEKVNPREKRRLLLHVLPERHFEAKLT